MDPASLLILPAELRINIIRLAVLPNDEIAAEGGVDHSEEDPSSSFSVLAHKTCHSDKSLDGACMFCMEERTGAINIAKLAVDCGDSDRILSLLTVCKQLYFETTQIFYSEFKFFVPYLIDRDDEDGGIYIHPLSSLKYFYTNTAPFARACVSNLTVAFDVDEVIIGAMDAVCEGVLAYLPNLKKFTVLIDTKALENNIYVLECVKLAQIAVKARVTVEISCQSPADSMEYSELDYDAYLEDIREDIHEVLDPLVEEVREGMGQEGPGGGVVVRTRNWGQMN